MVLEIVRNKKRRQQMKEEPFMYKEMANKEYKKNVKRDREKEKDSEGERKNKNK